MPQCEELSDFARTMTEFLLTSKGVPEEEPLLSTLHRAFSSLEKTLRQGGHFAGRCRLSYQGATCRRTSAPNKLFRSCSGPCRCRQDSPISRA